MHRYPNLRLKQSRLALLGLLLVTCYKGPIQLNQPPALPVENAWLHAAPEEVWSVKLISPPASLITLADGQLMVLTYRGELCIYNLIIGKLTGRVWQPLRMQITGYTLGDEHQILYFASARDKELHAYDLMAARKLWKLQYGDLTGNMTTVGQQLFAATKGGSIIAVNRAAGNVVWAKRFPGRFTNGVYGFGNRVLALSDRGQMYAFDVIAADSIAMAWQQEITVQPTYQAVPTPQGLLICDSFGRILVIEPDSGGVIFNNLLPAPIYSKPLVTDGAAIIATSSGRVYAINLDSGEIMWEYEGAGLVNLPIIAATGATPTIAVIPYSRGTVVALEIASGRLVWEHKFERPIRLAAITDTGLAVVDRRNRMHFLSSTSIE